MYKHDAHALLANNQQNFYSYITNEERIPNTRNFALYVLSPAELLQQLSKDDHSSFQQVSHLKKQTEQK